MLDAWIPASVVQQFSTFRVWNPDAGETGGAQSPVIWGDLLVPYAQVT